MHAPTAIGRDLQLSLVPQNFDTISAGRALSLWGALEAARRSVPDADHLVNLTFTPGGGAPGREAPGSVEVLDLEANRLKVLARRNGVLAGTAASGAAASSVTRPAGRIRSSTARVAAISTRP